MYYNTNTISTRPERCLIDYGHSEKALRETSPPLLSCSPPGGCRHPTHIQFQVKERGEETHSNANKGRHAFLGRKASRQLFVYSYGQAASLPGSDGLLKSHANCHMMMCRVALSRAHRSSTPSASSAQEWGLETVTDC